MAQPLPLAALPEMVMVGMCGSVSTIKGIARLDNATLILGMNTTPHMVAAPFAAFTYLESIWTVEFFRFGPILRLNMESAANLSLVLPFSRKLPLTIQPEGTVNLIVLLPFVQMRKTKTEEKGQG